MARRTRLGLYGGPRAKYGSFEGKEQQATPDGTSTFFAETSDGTILSRDGDTSDYAAARAGTAILEAITDATTASVGQSLSGGTEYRVFYWFLAFDVSAIPAGATTTVAALSFYLTQNAAFSAFTAQVRLCDWGDELTDADWVPGDELGALPLLASISSGTIGTAGSYKTLTSETALADAIDAARAGDGVLRVLVCSSKTVSGTAPSLVEAFTFATSDDTNDPTRKPKLDVEWEEALGERTRTVVATAALSKDGIAEQVVQVSASADNRSQEANTTTSQPVAQRIGTSTVNGDPTRHHLWRFLGVAVPQGVTVESATVTLRKFFNQHQPNYWTWWGEDTDNVTNVTGRIDTRPKTSASVVENTNTQRNDGQWYAWDVTAIVQEIIDRAGWASGNNLALIADGNGPVNGSQTLWYDHAADPDSAAKLTVHYRIGQQTLTVAATAALQATVSRTVEAMAALSATNSLTVEALAALSESGRILNVDATAAISHPDQTRTVEAMAALSTADNELTVSATAALMATFERTVPATAALMATRALTVTARAALSEETARELTVVATAALSRPVLVIPPARRGARPVFSLSVFGPLPGRRLVSQMALPADVALSFGSELPGGWARLDAGVIRPELRDMLTATQKQSMMLPQPAGVTPFGHVEIRTEGDRLVWEGRVATLSDVGGEIRGLTALGYGLTALRDQSVPALSGPAQTDVVVRTIVEMAAPLIELQDVGNPNVQRDLVEFAGMTPYDALEALAETGCGTCAGWGWTVYRRALRFFALTPNATPVYHLPADGTISRDLDVDAAYTAVLLRYSDLDGVERETPVLRDHDAQDRFGTDRLLTLSGGQMTPSAALVFARTELLKRSTIRQALRVSRDWQRGLELAGSSGTRPIWEARAGEPARVGDGPVEFITRVEYDAQTGRGAITLGRPASTDLTATLRKLVATDTAARSGRNPVTRTADSSR